MRISPVVAVAVLVLLLLTGCGRQSVVPVAAARTSPQVEIRRVKFVEELNPSKDPAAIAPTKWDVVVVQFPEDTIEQQGLRKLFAEPAETNSQITKEAERNALVRLGRSDSNIVLRARTSVFAGASTSEAASNLVAQMQQVSGTDILTFPGAITAGPNEAQLHVGNTQTVITGASSNRSPATPFLKQLSFGQTVTLQHLGTVGDMMQIRAVARDERFGGYARDEKKEDPLLIGSPPIFDVTIVGTQTELGTNEVLLLGSPPGFEVQKIVERVPKLSDIPIVGKLFTKVSLQTNHYRTVTIIRPVRE